MEYPQLADTPIREIIFSISFDEIVAEECFDKFLGIKAIDKRFKEKLPSTLNSVNLTNAGLHTSVKRNGYRLSNENEVINIRTGSFSYHILDGYKPFPDIQKQIIAFWNQLVGVAKEKLTVNSVSVRYINDFQIDFETPESRLIQIYPKYSSDRKIDSFQNLVAFNYIDTPEYKVIIGSTKPNEKQVLLDITVTNAITILDDAPLSLEDSFTPLQDIKNRAFFDSITAKALLRYLK